MDGEERKVGYVPSNSGRTKEEGQAVPQSGKEGIGSRPVDAEKVSWTTVHIPAITWSLKIRDVRKMLKSQGRL